MEHLQFDGFPVELYDGKFSGAFDVDEHIAQSIAHGDEVAFLVVGTTKGSSFTDTKDGQVKRTNTFKVTEALVIDNEELVQQVTDQVIAQGTQSVANQIPGQLTVDHAIDEDDDPFHRTADEISEPVAQPVQAAEPEVFSPEPEISQTADPVLKNFLEGQ